MASEIGIIGLSSFLFILIVFFYHGIKALNNSEQKTFFWYVLLAVLASILGYCVQMGVDTNFYSLDLGILFWLMLGMGDAAVRNIKII
jgi:O-antigen ligase